MINPPAGATGLPAASVRHLVRAAACSLAIAAWVMPGAGALAREAAPAVAAAPATTTVTAAPITPPREAFGFDIGADYQLVNYSQWESYLKKLATQSDRMKLIEIGKTSEGRTQYVAIVSSPQNWRSSIAIRLSPAVWRRRKG